MVVDPVAGRDVQFIIYEDGDECFVTTAKNEQALLRCHFQDEDRDVEDFNRHTVCDIAVLVRSEFQIF